MKFEQFIDNHWIFSAKTFGPSPNRYIGVLKHLELEIEEVRRDPTDAEEWADLIHLVVDGMLRATGCSGEDFVKVLEAKARKIRAREYPDWQTISPTDPIEHKRD